MTFDDFGLHPALVAKVGAAGYERPTPVQVKCIPKLLKGRDLIGIAQTGTGKTAAFVLPVLHGLIERFASGEKVGLSCLVLAPTRELAAQIKDAVIEFGLDSGVSVSAIYGGVEEVSQVKRLRKGVHVIVATPGRLLDLMGKRQLDFSELNTLIFDEADRMLHMGFRADIDKILEALPRKRQTLMFSATLPREVEALAKRYLYSAETIEIDKRSSPAETVEQCVYEVPEHLKAKFLSELIKDPKFKRVLVFVRMKEGVNLLTDFLLKRGIKAIKLHSGRTQEKRLKALKDFRDGKAQVLVATDIMARGIDIEGVTQVVNFDFPVNPEDYIHRIGRTGRAETTGEAISLIPDRDRNLLKRLELFTTQRLKRRKLKGFDYYEKRTRDNSLPPQTKKDWRRRHR